MPWQFIGNARAIGALAARVGAASPVRSYIFSGPEGVGKAAAALLLAQALNCTGEDPPCGACETCRRIAGHMHSDVQTVTIEPTAEGAARKAIMVEQVRDVENTVALSPYEGRTRVVIIDPADQMSDSAQNAFLKTLEEPPPHAVFVLVTTDAEGLLETVRSRCRRIEFGLVAAADIEAALTARGVDQAPILARLAAGRPGWALAAAATPKVLERRSEALDTARALASMSLADRIDLAEKMSDAFKRERAPVDETLAAWLGYWRDVLLAQSDAAGAIANVDRRDEINADAGRYDRGQVIAFVESIRQTRQHLRDNVQSRIALDALMLRVPGPLRAAVR